MPIRLSDEEFADLVSKSLNMTDVIRRLGRSFCGAAFTHVRTRIHKLGLSTSHFASTPTKRAGNWGGRNIPPEVILTENRLGRKEKTYAVRNSMLSVGFEEKCSQCGLGNEWNGKPITLQIDHIDGNNLNNNKENLRFVCPNCHSQTDTFGSKNVKRPLNPYAGKKNPISKESKERIRKQHRVPVKCTGCGVDFEMLRSRYNRIRDAFYCTRQCYITNAKPKNRSTKIIWPTDDELTELVKSQSMTSVSKQLGVSDTMVRKRCKRLGIEW